MNARPILLLHGALGSASQLEPVQRFFEASGRKVLVMNFSGHGGKPITTSFGIETFANEIIQFLQEQNVETIDVFGYSMGGYAALFAAYQNPSRFHNVATLGTKFDWNPEGAVAETKKLNPEKIIEKIPAFADALEKRHAPNDWKELLRQTASMMISLGNKPLISSDLLESIQQNVLIGLGDADDMTSQQFSRDVAKTLPHGEFILFENTPHPIEKVNLTLLKQTLENFFDKR